MPSGQDPAEGDRKTVERELARQENQQDGKSIKNPEQQAEKPGGTPGRIARGGASAKPTEPEGQQGKAHPQYPQDFQRGN